MDQALATGTPPSPSPTPTPSTPTATPGLCVPPSCSSSACFLTAGNAPLSCTSHIDWNIIFFLQLFRSISLRRHRSGRSPVRISLSPTAQGNRFSCRAFTPPPPTLFPISLWFYTNLGCWHILLGR
ncbi:hypothetical protein BS78_K181700 [Paspalum vaginatum]|uniref:Uncharacterized protein n=1 Tax=Paspalum vaginatum TaxID=158149 RepID=A0A9W7X635_9POAL|nr:hypothetical protein BS78_K181700 [Paspalum vaginatum]